MILKKLLGNKIKEIRKQNKYTQEMLADLVGIDPKNISKIENGNNYPSAETLTAIASALNVNVYELFVFENKISYEKMKQEILEYLDCENNVLYIYNIIKRVSTNKLLK